MLYFAFFIIKQPKFQPPGNIDKSGNRWLFRAAVAKINFLLFVFMDLNPPLDAL